MQARAEDRARRGAAPADRGQLLAHLATRQHGVVSLAQLAEIGLSADAVQRRVASGSLHRLHRGVFAVGHPRVSGHGRWLAAVLACGNDARLSHRECAALRHLHEAARARVDVCVPQRSIRPRDGIDVHTTSTWTPSDVEVHDGIPCTSVARTLVDLGDVESHRVVERAVERAEVQRILDLNAVEDGLARVGPRRGAGVLRQVMGGLGEPALTESELEEAFLALCESEGLPRPQVNVWLTLDGGSTFRVDFLFPAARLVVETDGFAYHATRSRFESDRRRDQALQRGGYRVVRCTWRQVLHEGTTLAATIRALLAVPIA